MQVLTKLATAEKWSRMQEGLCPSAQKGKLSLLVPKKKGLLVKKEVTKSGNIKLVLKTKKGEESVYVLKRNNNLHLVAQSLAVGDTVSVSLRRYLGKFYCTKVGKINSNE